jgi:hypothetical protein
VEKDVEKPGSSGESRPEQADFAQFLRGERLEKLQFSAL